MAIVKSDPKGQYFIVGMDIRSVRICTNRTVRYFQGFGVVLIVFFGRLLESRLCKEFWRSISSVRIAQEGKRRPAIITECFLP